MLFLNASREIEPHAANPGQPKHIPKKLNLNIPASKEGKIDFTFDPIASVIYGDGTVSVELAFEAGSNPNAECHIAGYCVSQINPKVIKKVRRNNKPDVVSATEDVPQNGAHGRFPRDTNFIVFDVTLEPGHLVFIGLIIAVKYPGEDYKDHLFDPQLGNGPPNPNPGNPGNPENPGGGNHGGPRQGVFGSLIPLD